MRLSILFFLIFSGICHSQITFETIEPLLQKQIKKLYENNDETKKLKKVLDAFYKAEAPKKNYYTKNNAGIAFNLESNPAMINPAQYAHKDSKILIAALRDRTTKGNSPEMNDYVDAYFNDINKVFKNKVFQYLASNKPSCNGSYKMTKNELVITDDLAFSFMRGTKSWDIIVSIDKHYDKRENPRILVYAFRRSIIDDDLFPSKEIFRI